MFPPRPGVSHENSRGHAWELGEKAPHFGHRQSLNHWQRLRLATGGTSRCPGGNFSSSGRVNLLIDASRSLTRIPLPLIDSRILFVHLTAPASFRLNPKTATATLSRQNFSAPRSELPPFPSPLHPSRDTGNVGSNGERDQAVVGLLPPGAERSGGQPVTPSITESCARTMADNGQKQSRHRGRQHHESALL